MTCRPTPTTTCTASGARAGPARRAGVHHLMLPEERRYVDAITEAHRQGHPAARAARVEPAANGEAAPTRRGAARPSASSERPQSRRPLRRRSSVRPTSPAQRGTQPRPRRAPYPGVTPAEPDMAERAAAGPAGHHVRQREPNDPRRPGPRVRRRPDRRHGRSRAAVHAPRGAQRGAAAELTDD